jgi:hypothetical protein
MKQVWDQRNSHPTNGEGGEVDRKTNERGCCEISKRITLGSSDDRERSGNRLQCGE